MLASLCGASIPEELRQGLAAIDVEDKQELLDFGVEHAVKECIGLLEWGAPGIHFYTMDRSISTEKIVKRLRSEGLL